MSEHRNNPPHQFFYLINKSHSGNEKSGAENKKQEDSYDKISSEHRKLWLVLPLVLVTWEKSVSGFCI